MNGSFLSGRLCEDIVILQQQFPIMLSKFVEGCGGGERERKKNAATATLYQSTGVNLNQVQGRPCGAHARERDEQLLLSNDAFLLLDDGATTAVITFAGN